MKEMLKKYWIGFQKGTKTMFKEFFNKETNKKQRANMWTFSRLIISFLIPICSLLSIAINLPSPFTISFIVTIFGGITDYFDGKSARKYNSTSEYGKLLDQMADKIFAMMIGINLSLFNPMYLITLLGEGIIVATNTPYKIKYSNLKINSTIIGKVKQWPLFSSLALGFLAAMNPIFLTTANISIIITFIFQVATALNYIKSNNDSIKEYKKTLEKNNLVEIEEDFTKDNEKVKTKEIENKNSIVNNNISKKELYINLRDVLNQAIISESNNLNEEKLSKQKTKSIKK